MNSDQREFYYLDSEHRDSKRIKQERAKARELKKSDWWHQKISKGHCEYCGNCFESSKLTMDHRIPLARGGASIKSNLVACCESCNQQKGLDTPVDRILRELSQQKQS